MEHKTGIHVQLTVDVELKKAARDFIAAAGIEYQVSKGRRRWLWNMVIKGLEAQKRVGSIPRSMVAGEFDVSRSR